MQQSQEKSSDQSKTKPRPTGVTIVGIVVILGGIFGLFGAVPVLVSNPATMQLALAGVVVLFSILAFILGPGLLRGKNWAWTFGIGFYAISIPLGIVEIFLGGNTGLIGGIVRTLIGVIFLFYLMRPSVKMFFGR